MPMPEALREAERRLRRFGLNEPAAGALARASHRVNLAVALAVALLPGLWTLLYNLVAWPNGISTLSNLCLSAQLVALAAVLAAHAVTFNICEYVPLRDWLEEYAGFLFLYRGRCVQSAPAASSRAPVAGADARVATAQGADAGDDRRAELWQYSVGRDGDAANTDAGRLPRRSRGRRALCRRPQAPARNRPRPRPCSAVGFASPAP